MPFEYNGLWKLSEPEIFTTILTSAVDDTALAYGFRYELINRGVDQAFKKFEEMSFAFMSLDDQRPERTLIGLSALAMYCCSLHPVVRLVNDREPKQQVIGLQDVAVRKNPVELAALTFGMAIIETQISCKRDGTGLLHGPAAVNFGAVELKDIRRALHLIATHRNLELRNRSVSLRPVFWHVTRLVRKLRNARFRRSSRG